jgi:hypothetical protein
MWAFLAPILGSIVKGVTGYVKRRQELKAARHEAKLHAIELKAAADAKRMEINANADLESIKNQRESLKDEFLLYILFIPFIGSFIPGLQPYIKQGFANLAQLPIWYQVAIIGIIVSVFGLRFMVGRFFGEKK